MKFTICLATLVATCASTVAAEREQGWGLFFSKTTFEGKQAPLAMLSQKTNAIGKFSIGVACTSDGIAIPFFQEQFAIGDGKPLEVSFKNGEEIETYKFSYAETPVYGNLMLIEKNNAASFFAFMGTGDSIKFSAKSKQGEFSTVGASEVFRLMKGFCSELPL